MSGDFIPAARELWHGSPRWRSLFLASIVSTIMVIVFPPNFLGASKSGSGAYTPSTGSAPPPPIDTGRGAQPAPGPQALPPAPGAGGAVVNLVAPAPIKISPGTKLEDVTIDKKPQDDDDFGKSTRRNTSAIKPGASLQE
ncbi:hypothetical protein AGMMS50256_14760 [Betaproteobacteria bacterium]|nr:hypothetical protein AGMMS50256_14760 [Betaproteobacteria bacterium]